jgi:hypothetical protein
MHTHETTRLPLLMLLASALAIPSVATAQTATTTPGGENVTNKIGARYEPFVGPDSPYVVAGLRDGTAITLPATNPANTAGVVVIQSPTGPMGYGNVDKSLALAQVQLAREGIYQPTSEQLQAALTGGDVLTPSGEFVHMDGVLTLRSQGRGWGDIAQQYGVKLGDVVHGKAVSVVSAEGTTAPAVAKGKGVVTAAGGSPDTTGATRGKSSATGKGIVSASGAQLGTSPATGKGQAAGRGLVTAGGGSPGSASVVHGNSGGAGKGIVTAGGGSAPVGGGNGKGQALGHSK